MTPVSMPSPGEPATRFVEREAWQIAEIKQGLLEADTGDFATDEETAALDAKWNHPES